ncbi:hypothetical protein [Aliiroseovarius sp.]|uniref:hypothetical protein n=1 Tax=Aliiroseovarius sp. TaxID=1872442 RepID=UPI00261C3F6D|nr:hypothetical protein [Aliiroseovarius sp.]
MMRFMLVVLALTLAGAFVTKPSGADVDRMLRERIAAEIDRGAGLDPNDPAAQIALGLCRVNQAACVDLLRQVLRVDYEDELFYARIEADLPGRGKRTCIGAFTRVVCPGFLND